LGSVKNNSLGQIQALKESGACGFKLSLFDTDPERFPRITDGNLLEAFSIIARTSLSAGIHAENDEIIKQLIQKSIKEKRTYPLAHCETRPEVSETESVLRGLEIARAAGVRLHLYHLSCSRSIDLAMNYRREGCSVTLETCPHYLVFSEEDMDRLGGKLRINPPVRKKDETKRLWIKLREDAINCVGSDHAPWPLQKKNKPSIFDNSCGAPGVETLLPVMFSEGVAKNRITLVSLIKILAANPAKIFGLSPRKGTLAPGSDADIVIFDPKEKWTIKAEEMHTKAGWTLYEGMQITGRVKTTIVRGQIVFNNNKITGKKGHGVFIKSSNTPK
jgi:allantoinase